MRRSTGARCATPPDPSLPRVEPLPVPRDLYLSNSQPARKSREHRPHRRARRHPARCRTARRGCATSQPAPLDRARARRSPDVPLLPRLLGRPSLRLLQAGGRRRPPELQQRRGRQRVLRQLRARQDLRAERRRLRTAAADHHADLHAPRQRVARAPSATRPARRARGHLQRRPPSSSTAGAWRSTSSPTTSPKRCARSRQLRPINAPGGPPPAAAAARLLPRPLRAAARRGRAGSLPNLPARHACQKRRPEHG